eukprot:4707509-Pyramimonas_sp.AAC.1
MAMKVRSISPPCTVPRAPDATWRPICTACWRMKTALSRSPGNGGSSERRWRAAVDLCTQP